VSETSTDAPARRAPAMSAADRRSHIIDATVPLLLAHGGSVTTKQIAEAAGVAEGTIFRVFADKQAVVDAAVQRYLDPQPLRDALGRIDPALPVESKVRQVIELLQRRFQGIFALMAAVGARDRPPVPGTAGRGFAELIAGLFAPDLEALDVAPDRVGPFLRLLAFATSIEPFQASMPIELDELVDLALHGIAGERPAHRSSPKKNRCSSPS
jgi:AcrR family transcriptional regulator